MFLRNLVLQGVFILLIVSCSSTNTNFSGESNYPEIMEMKGNFEQNDETGTFILSLRRIKEVQDEYLPSSENFRVIVRDSFGSTIWQSNKDMNYFMVISDVLPKKADETLELKTDWNLRNDAGKKVSAGKYSASLVIPAKPNHYVINIEFEIK